MTQALEIAYCDLQRQKNNALHHTEEISDKRLIVRRGQPFLIGLQFKERAYQEGKDNIIFSVETGPWPDDTSGTKAIFTLRKALVRRAWGAAVESNGPNSLMVVIMPSSNAIIGQYTLKVQIAKGSTATTYKLGTFVLLFNPWCADDDVFLDNEPKRQEYVMNDYGYVYQGNQNWISPRPWNFGQFEDDIMDISLKLLDKNLNYLQDAFKDLTQRNSPVYVSRVVCAMINSNDDDSGVLQGNWSGDYKKGVSPSAWNGSTAILRKWFKKDCEPVKYGECWVFAAVMCTVMRSLGIPTRVVTNFDSAHDTNSNLIIDEYYDTNGKKLSKESNDSIWNFHVWCECWMARRDLPPEYGGWQVLDPTPQETSNGIYCCGPASVKAIKKGEVHLNYDGPFVFSMVNADCVTWTLSGKNKEKYFCDPHLIGNRISTKCVGSDEREDITHTYKYDEGTIEERKVFQKALQRLRSRNKMLSSNGAPYSHITNGFASNGVSPEQETVPDREEPNRPLRDAKLLLKFKLRESPQLGQTINLVLLSVNFLSVPKTLKLSFSAQSLKHTGKPGVQFWKDSKYIDLGPKEEKWILLQIPYSQYGKYLEDNNLIRVAAVGEQNITWEKVLVEKDINLAMPQIMINPKGSARVNQPCRVQLIFSNPLTDDVSDCLLLIEGSGLLKSQMKILAGTMKAKEKSILEFELVPYKAGLKQLQVNFSSNKFRVIKGFTTILVNN
ncbi:protein-glutamine gamma-glutamyltransferase 5-like isoform X1 [Bufo bufo]|uniref:protein-glutamine gamma-glutamyltransferase 5-like isoform X1 n=2 Tax=Bufo bufo TaxID=8384 RepID=UPI001ABE59FB|nr:protein-glutamine gamma-glutamyltransferase 5-like isoform X1 [Bufo bufo]